MGHKRKQSDERILHNNNNHSHIHSVVQPGLHRHQERPTDGEEVGGWEGGKRGCSTSGRDSSDNPVDVGRGRSCRDWARFATESDGE